MERNKCIEVFDERGTLVWHRAFDEKFFDRLQRLLELIPDEDALSTLDKVIKALEAPKLELADKLSKELTKNGEMTTFLQEALTALPMKQLKEMKKRLTKLKMKREPGGDCLIIENGEKSHRLHL